MTPDLQKKILETFPLLYARCRELGLPCFLGFECDDGWYNLIYRLSEKITEEIEKNKNASRFVVIQVKTKYGGLRFYVKDSTENIDKLIDRAEEESFHICEVCGAEGSLNTEENWKKTLCKNHKTEKPNDH